MRYRWPGNVRELQNVIEQAIWLRAEPTIGLEDLPEAIRKHPGATNAATRAATAARRSALRRARAGPIRLLGTRPSVVPGPGHDTSRRSGTGQARVRRRRATTVRCCGSFGMPESDYHRFHNFLTAHACKVDFRNYRTGVDVPNARPPALLQGFLIRRSQAGPSTRSRAVPRTCVRVGACRTAARDASETRAVALTQEMSTRQG